MDLAIVESHHGPASVPQEEVPPAVVFGTLRRPMRGAIDLDHDLPAEMDEIRDVRTDRMLTTEFEAVAIGFAELLPENDFCLRHRVTQGFGAWT